ncbi:MAG: long-chain fatty acid--CoA ligase [Deltaproteobacteria bacterium]|nr:MAG: long-chain fatty acid--CoA ligase [Deltaproteobacteria bacterium]
MVLIEGAADRQPVLDLRHFLPDNFDEEAVNARMQAVAREDLASIVYTSGTTGPPKGAMLTHDNILSAVEAAAETFSIDTGDSCLSFLPLSHVFERVDGYYFMLIQGATINYAESIDSVPTNLQEVKPTLVISVPRLFEKMYARVMERVTSGPWLKKQIFFAALKACTRELHLMQEGRPVPKALAHICALARDKVFSKLREPLGGRIRFFVSGGAPLAQNVAEFFLAAGLPIYEGYGLTETCAGIAANCEGHVRLGTVGRCFPGTEVSLAEDGEILIRGKTVFKGYWQDPARTAEAIQDGWFRTGDIGTIDRDDYLRITDRKKDLIITAGGENIAPQLIENSLKEDKFIANAFVFGNRKPYLVGLLVPNFENLEKYARLKKIPYLDHCSLVTHPAILDLIRRRIDRIQSGQPGFMHIKRFTLLSRDFSGREITPTLKLKRKVIRENFSDLIEGMYLPQDHGIHDAGYCLLEEGTPPDKD